VTPLYRAPEVFTGSENYDYNIDIWSLGCIFGEMVSKKYIFYGENEFEILNNILKYLNFDLNINLLLNFYRFHNLDSDLSVSCLEELLEKSKNTKKCINWRSKFPQLDEDGIDLISKMLEVDPNKRISPREALVHNFLRIQ